MILPEVGPMVMHGISVSPASWVLHLLLTHAAITMASVTLKFPGFPQSGCPGGSQEETNGVTLSLCNPEPLTVDLCSPTLSSLVLRKHPPWASKTAQYVLAEMLATKSGDLSSVP